MKARSIFASLLAAAAIAIPAQTAGANGFGARHGGAVVVNDFGQGCRIDRRQSQVRAGVLGAAAGALFGNQVAPRGGGAEGAALGAVFGGLVGSQIAGAKNPCPQGFIAQPVRQNAGFVGGGFVDPRFQQGFAPRGFQQRGVVVNRGFNRGFQRGFQPTCKIEKIKTFNRFGQPVFVKRKLCLNAHGQWVGF
ncbi:MAG: hypothetical protein ACFB2Z_12010 [Maricaulaceae bacterium]